MRARAEVGERRVASNVDPKPQTAAESAGIRLGATCLVASLVVHSVFAPLPTFSALLRRHTQATAGVKRAAFSEIAVDLIGDPPDQSAPAPAKNIEPLDQASDVSAADEGTQNPKPRPQRPHRAPGQPSTGATSQASGPRLDDSMRASSNSSLVLARSLVNDCSLSVLVDLTSVRAHPLAAQLGALLGQWQSLLAEPGLDPLRDVDRLLVIGPELRASGRGLAVVQHHLDATQISAVLARALARGAAAGATAQERFYEQISPELLLIAPDRESRRTLHDFALAQPPEGTIGTLYVDTPNRALRNLPFELPSTVHWLRGSIQATADNGFAVDIQAGDENVELAKRDAHQLTRNVLSLKTKYHTRFIERAVFEAREGVIVGRLEITPPQVGALLDVLSDYVKAPPEPPPPPELTSASANDESEPKSEPPEARSELEARPVDAGVSEVDAAAHNASAHPDGAYAVHTDGGSSAPP